MEFSGKVSTKTNKTLEEILILEQAPEKGIYEHDLTDRRSSHAP